MFRQTNVLLDQCSVDESALDESVVAESVVSQNFIGIHEDIQNNRKLLFQIIILLEFTGKICII